MTRALELARCGRFTTTPNPNVGCVLVKEGHIVGEGFHLRAGEAHAEINALGAAGANAQGATAYVTLEPCSHYGRTPPCAEALIKAGVKRVVVATQDPNPQVAGRGLYMLQQAGIEVVDGVMVTAAEQVNKSFFKRMRTGFPYLQLKLAASLDGRTAMASGESKWITSAEARQDVQRFRATSSAILSTSATVLADDPCLNVRWQELDAETQQIYPESWLRQPTRIILDSKNRLTPQHRVVQQPGETWLIRERLGREDWPAGVEQLILPNLQGKTDLVMLMMTLAKREINSLWLEVGATAAGALLQSGMIDELILYIAPKLLGDEARGLCKLPGLSHLADAPQFTINEVRQIGPDLRLRLAIKTD